VNVAASAVAVLGTFKRGEATRSEVRTVRVPQGYAGSMQLELVAPSRRVGVHFLSVGLMIGGKLQFFRQIVHLVD
jgi:hypothetical protein